MRAQELPKPIQSLIADLLKSDRVVWLVGSRVNPTGKPPNDWDFLIFGDTELLEQLRAREPVLDLDLLVVVDAEHFQSPWPRLSDGVIKSGSLTSWNWKVLGKDAATYEGTKWPDDWGSQKKGVRVVL